MNKNLILGAVLVVVIVGAIYLMLPGSPDVGNYNVFAQCLTDSGAKMYGAYWCSHCENQKKEFGSSWDNINYVECSLPNKGGQTEECNSAGIKGYPTWEFDDGTRLEGEVSFSKLSEKTGCAQI